MPDIQLPDVKIAGHEIAAKDIYRIKIDYIKLQCAFLNNVKNASQSRKVNCILLQNNNKSLNGNN